MNWGLMKIHTVGKSEQVGANGTNQKTSQMNGGRRKTHAIAEPEEKNARCTKKGRRNQEQAERSSHERGSCECSSFRLIGRDKHKMCITGNKQVNGTAYYRQPWRIPL